MAVLSSGGSPAPAPSQAHSPQEVPGPRAGATGHPVAARTDVAHARPQDDGRHAGFGPTDDAARPPQERPAPAGAAHASGDEPGVPYVLREEEGTLRRISAQAGGDKPPGGAAELSPFGGPAR
jgi:hypothetical protein